MSKRATAATEARSAAETPAPMPMCATDAMGVTPESTAKLYSLSATSVAMCTQESVARQTRPNQINPARETTLGNNNQPPDGGDSLYIYIHI